MLDASAGGAGGRVFGLPRGKEKGAGCGGGLAALRVPVGSRGVVAEVRKGWLVGGLPRGKGEGSERGRWLV